MKLEKDVKVEKKATESSENQEETDTKDVRATEDRTIFVKNLPFEIKEEELKTLFVNAIDVRILRKNTGIGRGKAFIEMDTVEHAENVRPFVDSNRLNINS